MDPEVHNRIHKSSPRVPVLSQNNPVPTLWHHIPWHVGINEICMCCHSLCALTLQGSKVVIIHQLWTDCHFTQ